MTRIASRRRLCAALFGVGAFAVQTLGAAEPALRSSPRAPAPRYAEDQDLAAAINGAWRPAADRARDSQRHPLESLTFWGLRPGMTIVDLQPGGGYWTQILAPYAQRTHGVYIAGVADLADPAVSANARKNRAGFEAKFSQVSLYGPIVFTDFGPRSKPVAPAGSVDLVLTSRELHNWVSDGKLDTIMSDAFQMLKPGGVLAVEDHRADPGPEAPNWANGYIATETVERAAARAGFKLDAASEINANPKDVKNYPFGVWTLPPTRQSSATGAPDPSFDRARYDAIGESDRMTLRFKKPE